MGGGLGGGSSDAATALLALNHLWGTGLTRERLLESAAHEITRHGAGASVRDIAEAAGYSQGAVYANFESKELMFLELLRRHMEKEAGELEALLSRADHQPGGALAALNSWLETMNADRDWSVLSMELQMCASRDEGFAAHYDRLFAQHRATMGRLTERLFAEVGRELAESGPFRKAADEA